MEDNPQVNSPVSAFLHTKIELLLFIVTKYYKTWIFLAFHKSKVSNVMATVVFSYLFRSMVKVHYSNILASC